jgi:hypothetical protein
MNDISANGKKKKELELGASIVPYTETIHRRFRTYLYNSCDSFSYLPPIQGILSEGTQWIVAINQLHGHKMNWQKLSPKLAPTAFQMASPKAIPKAFPKPLEWNPSFLDAQ